MGVATCSVVRLRILDHEMEVAFEFGPFFILARVQLGTYRAQIHRVLDDIEVAITRELALSLRVTEY